MQTFCNSKFRNPCFLFDVADVADDTDTSCWSLAGHHWWYLILVIFDDYIGHMLLIDTDDTVVDRSPVVIGHPPQVHISAANPYMVALSSFRLIHLSAKSSWYMVTHHASKEPVLLSASEFQTCRSPFSGGNPGWGWSWSRFHRRWWKSSVCN